MATWLELLPLAVVPLWQVAQVPGAALLWPIVAGFQPVVWWQTSHEAVVATWLDFLPLAEVPLWQVAQVPGATLLWFMRAGSQPDVWWQTSHEEVVGIWLEFLPLAVVPLWQVAHVPGTTLLCCAVLLPFSTRVAEVRPSSPSCSPEPPEHPVTNAVNTSQRIYFPITFP